MTQTQVSRLVTIPEVANWDGAPLYLFVGISTAGSSVHDSFPVWANNFAPGAVLRGIDLPESAEPEVFRSLVRAMRDSPRVHGAVVTSHKLRLYAAIENELDQVDPLVGITHEINSLDTRDGIAAFARDAQSIDIVLSRSTPPRRLPMYCIGAGGSAIALMLAQTLDMPATLAARVPVIPNSLRGSVTILGRRQSALDDIAQIGARAGLSPNRVSLIRAATAKAVSARTAQAPEGAIIINATGLGKLTPGSPLTDAAGFPSRATAWDFNYRGPLTFLEQAEDAHAVTIDGWDYFVAGWGAALSAITGTELTAERFNELLAVSSPFRPVRT